MLLNKLSTCAISLVLLSGCAGTTIKDSGESGVVDRKTDRATDRVDGHTDRVIDKAVDKLFSKIKF